MLTGNTGAEMFRFEKKKKGSQTFEKERKERAIQMCVCSGEYASLGV